MRITSYLLILSFLMIFGDARSQISKGGTPHSFTKTNLERNVHKIDLFADVSLMIENDVKTEADIAPHKIGFTIPTNYTPENSGSWFDLENGDRIWKMEIESSNAEALAVYFTDFKLADDAELFLYDKTRTQVLGAFTSDNNVRSGLFATQLIAGDIVVFEYYEPAVARGINPFVISEIGYVYRDSGYDTYKGFNSSGDCEVNINCAEGQNWQEQKRGVTRIQVKSGNTLSWCTGSLVNNTRRDLTPYLLTASHCGLNASASDYENWVFYFNYESEDCDDPANEPDLQTMTGSSLISKAEDGTTIGSDFKLLLLNEEVPDEYNPYFNGWSRTLSASPNGVSIHHPAGDIKKISYYASPLISSNYDAVTDNPDGLYWRVVWAETTNGHGVTEGGSSGSPIFNDEGLIVGTLTGGRASCSQLTAPDYYGKFSFSWESNGITDDKRLKPWLDPDNRNLESLSGISYDDVLFVPEFVADTVVIPIGSSVIFTDLSIGMPTQWVWTFEGGTPGSSSLQTPPPIRYQVLGTYDVSLQILDADDNETLLKTDYIKVVPTVSPVPTFDKLTIYLGTSPVDNVIFTIYDESGREIEKHDPGTSVKFYDFYLGKYSSGYYFLKVETPSTINMHKIVVF